MSDPFYSKYVWATDKLEFFNTTTRRMVKQDTIVKAAIEYNPKFADLSEQGTLIKLIKNAGRTHSEWFPRTGKLNVPEELRKAYSIIGPQLKVKLKFVKNRPLIYTYDENNEYRFWANANPDAFLDLALSSKSLLKIFNAAYDAPELCSSYLRTKLTISDFIKKQYDYFRADESNFLHADIALISWDNTKPAFKQLDPAIVQKR